MEPVMPSRLRDKDVDRSWHLLRSGRGRGGGKDGGEEFKEGIIWV
jgi:hypothetical protein